MPKHKQRSNSEDGPGRQKHEDGQDNHADANRPDNLQDAKTEGDVKGPGEINNNQLDEDQPQSAREKEPSRFREVPSLHLIKKRRGTRQKNKYGCAEMCDPPCKEEQGSGCRQIGWLGIPCAECKVHANMIQRHDDHYQSAQKINRDDSCFCVAL